ncbi:hypothetical protein SLS58_001388 [Diplodia intermedia]|uniref:Uncharacterized protein n=1 Tax=Diplodia intermedia TaxID=856260 RepID=A0ABR3U3L1_9PEZI
MAADLFAQATKTTIYPDDGPWVAFPEQQHEMELLWMDVSVAAVQAGFIKDPQLREFQRVPRKKLGVKAKQFVGNINGRWTENGVWLVAYPLLTADDKTWIARLDVRALIDSSCISEYVKNPVLTIQHLVEDRNIWDHTSLAFDRGSKRLRLAPGENLDELDLVRHTAIDVHHYKHRDIFPRTLTAKERDAVERKARASSSRDTPSEPRASETPAARSVGSRARWRVVFGDSEDEQGATAGSGPSDPSSSGLRASAMTNLGVSQAGEDANAAPGNGSSEGGGHQAESNELEKALQRNKALETMVREQASEIIELRLRLAGGAGR